MTRTSGRYEGPALAVFMVGAGLGHFLAPRAYEQIVPHLLQDPGFWVLLSGAVEIGCGAMVAVPRTRRAGAWLSAGLLIAVFPANVRMALDGGLAGRPFPLGSPVVAWLRLPLQVPLVWWAGRVATR